MSAEHACFDNRERRPVPGSDFQYEVCAVCDKTRCDARGMLFWSLDYAARKLVCCGDETTMTFLDINRDER